MLNKTSMMLAACVITLSSGVSFAANDQSYDGRSHYNQSDADNASAYRNGYNFGYDDAMARRDRDDHFRSDAWHAGNWQGDRGRGHMSNNSPNYDRGAYYYGSDCTTNTGVPTVVGAIAGGAIGSGIGHGNGAATVAGVILGGLAGNAIARDMDCSDRHYAMSSYSAGFEGRIGERYDWRNAANHNYGSFTPVREYRRDGNTCRDFDEVSMRSGREYTRNGTACRHSDGNWYLQ